jgi:hypothetical protein
MITFREIQEEIAEDVQDPGSPKAKGAELFARCRAASTAAHYAHLMTSSYAAHMALNAFYDGIIPLADAVAESMIGRYGRFEAFPNVKESSTDGLQIIGNLTKWIDANRALISDLSEIQNDIDTILSLCNSTAYKLRELK